MIQRVGLTVELQEDPPNVGRTFPLLVSIGRERDLAGREDVMIVEAVLLEAPIGQFDQPEPAPRLLGQSDSQGVVAHEPEVLEKRG